MKGKYSEKEISYMRHYFTENSATGNQEYYINIGDDILDSTTNASWATKPSTKELVQGLITTKQKKMIKEEIKVWMDDHFQKALQKEASKLLKDIENLKEEKLRLGKSISTFRQELRKTKKEIREEIKAMEEILEQHHQKVLRFHNIDL